MRARVQQALGGLSRPVKQTILRISITLLLSLCALLLLIQTDLEELVDEERAQKYANYLKQYSKQYAPQQELYRKFIFYHTYDTLIFSDKHLNQKYYQGINQFSDLTQQEFQEMYLMVTSLAAHHKYQEMANFQDDYYYDWSPLLPPPQNTRDYDASHVFAIVTSLEFELRKQESFRQRQNGLPLDPNSPWISLSKQQVLDCCLECRNSRQPGEVYEFLSTHGVTFQTKYPYVSSIYEPPGPCKEMEDVPRYRLKDYYQTSSCMGLVDQLKLGPVIVWVDAREWREYQGGILQSCGIKRNHYALLVGKGLDYWKIRNSWGPRWGEYGYIRIKLGNTCGICSKATYLAIQQQTHP